MKKLILSLFSTGLIITSLYADMSMDEIYATLPGAKPICSEYDTAIILFNDKRHQGSGFGGPVARSYFDTKTIQIDKKNKTVDVWISYIFNASGRAEQIKALGDRYANIGTLSQLRRIFYSENKMVQKSLISYNCDGTVIASYTYDNSEPWSISPHSMDEQLMKEIMKKYNLK